MLTRIAFRNVRVHWKQSLAALLSISVAFICFVVFQGYMLNVAGQYLDGYRNRSMYGDVLVQNSLAYSDQGKSDPWKFNLTFEQQQKISKLLESRKNQIVDHVRFLVFSGLISTGSISKIFWGQSFDVQSGAHVRSQWAWNTLYGKPLHLAGSDSAIMLGQSLAAQLGCEPDQVIHSLRIEGGYPSVDRPFHCRRPDVQLSVTTQVGNLNALDFTIEGLVDGGYKDIDSRYLTISIEQAQKLLNTDQISFWTIKLNDDVDVKKWIQDLDQEVKLVDPNLRAVSWIDHEFGEIYLKTMSLLNIFRNFVTVVVAFISVLSVMNTMVKIVKERTREIGTLLSLGFQRGQVLSIFLQESLFLAFLGSIVGALLGAFLSLIVNHMGISYKAGILSEAVPFQILIDPELYLFAFCLLIGVTVATSYFSCRGTIQKKIVDCLGHV